MKDIIYIKVSQKIRVSHASVTIGEIADVWCSNTSVLARCKALHYTTMQCRRGVESVMKVIETIQKEFPAAEVENLGETDFILEYILPGKRHVWWEWIKAAAVCVIVFFGSAFSIITFNEDVSVQQVFSGIHRLMTGQERQGLTFLEGGYALGIFLGILVFYNHFRRQKRCSDPTPLEVEMRTYEREVNQTVLDQTQRRQERQKRKSEDTK